MNLKTTLVLLVLAVAGGSWFYVTQKSGTPPLPPSLGLTTTPAGSAPAATLTVLEEELTPGKITRIEIRRADQPILLEKGKDSWTIEGKWLTRPREVEELVGL